MAVEINGPCAAHTHCASGYCKAGKCARNISGRPCAGNKAKCPTGTICHLVSRHCVSPGHSLKPASCEMAYDCPWGEFCDKYHKCVPKFPEGQKCNKDKQCQDRTFCVEQLCVRRCLSDGDCENGQECKARNDGLPYCRNPIVLPPPPGILPLWGVLVLSLIIAVMLFFLTRCLWRFSKRGQRQVGVLEAPITSNTNYITSSPHEIWAPVPQAAQISQTPIIIDEATSNWGRIATPSRELVFHMKREETPPLQSEVKIVEKTREHDLSEWPEAIKVPDPYEYDVPSTPAEQREFGAPYIGQRIPAHLERASYSPRENPDINTQSVWNRT